MAVLTKMCLIRFQQAFNRVNNIFLKLFHYESKLV